MKKTIRTILVAGIAVLAAACSETGSDSQSQETAAEEAVQEESATAVEVAVAGYQDVPQTEVYTSSVEANVVNNIAPQSSSRIQKINVEVGDFVRAGQILAEMDKVNLEQAKLQILNDSTELVRIRGLFEQGGVSKSDLEAMELAYNVRKTTYSNLEENTILRSPASGVVTARNYDRGDMFSMGKPIYVVQEITPVKILIGISETDYTKIKKGDSVEITVDALPGQEFSGKINRIYPTMNAATHTFNVEVVVPNRDRVLRPGMYARVKITFATNHSIVVPDSAVSKQTGSGQRYVFVVNPDKTVTTKNVTVGRHFGAEYEILSGLEDGETVVVKGNASLRSGSQVEF